jgi:hypothetical protein
MRGWGRPPISKASIPDCGLGIRATQNLAEKRKKGRRGGQEGRPVKSVEMRDLDLRFEGEL